MPAGIWLYLQGLPWLSATLYAVTVAAWMPWYRSKVWGLFAPYAVYIVPLVILPSLVKGLPGMRTEWKGRKV